MYKFRRINSHVLQPFCSCCRKRCVTKLPYRRYIIFSTDFSTMAQTDEKRLAERGKRWYTEIRRGVSDTEKDGIKIAAQNRKAHHDYFVEDTFEAGIELFGTEVKSIRQGTLNLKDSYCIVKDGELFAYSLHISPYEKGNIFNRDPDRPKRLLMHRREIAKLQQYVKRDGYALVPLQVYFRKARVKVAIGLCKGKKNYDKRDSTAVRDANREMERAVKNRGKGS